MMTPEEIQAHITPLLLEKVTLDQTRRGEALKDFLAINLPELPEESGQGVARIVPALPESLWRKWIGLFIDRLLETIPQNQLEELCNAAPVNNATLALVYLLFMESERMEKQIAQDMTELDLSGQDGTGNAALDVLSVYLKARLEQRN